MANLYVNTPSNVTYTLNLDYLRYDGGGLGPTNTCATTPNGLIIAAYGQGGAYRTPNVQYVVWGWHIPTVIFVAAFHLTTSGRPIPFTIASTTSDGCELVSWDCESHSAPSSAPIYAYVLAMGW